MKLSLWQKAEFFVCISRAKADSIDITKYIFFIVPYNTEKYLKINCITTINEYNFMVR